MDNMTLQQIYRDYRSKDSCFSSEPTLRSYERARRSLLWRRGMGGQMCPFEDSMDWRARMARNEYFALEVAQ